MNWLFEFVQRFDVLAAQYDGLFVLVLILSLTLIAHLVANKLLFSLQTHMDKRQLLLQTELLKLARLPLVVMIWTLGGVTAIQVVVSAESLGFTSAISLLRELVVVGNLTWFLMRLITWFEQLWLASSKTKNALDPATVRIIVRLLRLSLLIFTLLIILQMLGVSISGILAFGGVGGLAVGFAAKDLLANFFGGMIIYLDRPFTIGDWIRSPDREIEGNVEDIGWRQTRIRTFDKRPLYVPNASFASISVENPSRMSHRRIYEYIGVRYSDTDKLQNILTKVQAMLEQHPDIDTRQTLMVNLDRFGPSSLDFFIYTFTKVTVWVKYHQIKQDIMLQIMQIIEDEGAEFAFPTTTLHLAEVPPTMLSKS